jgi:hypothetical protein
METTEKGAQIMSAQVKALKSAGIVIKKVPALQELTLSERRKISKNALNAECHSASRAFKDMRGLFLKKETRELSVSYLCALLNKGDDVVTIENDKVSFDPSILGLNTFFVAIVSNGLFFREIVSMRKSKSELWKITDMLSSALKFSVTTERERAKLSKKKK